MKTYLSRYQANECEAVWRELQSLGSAVREEPVYSDAVAVAQETMRRARANIETLIERLTALGYRFGKKGESYDETGELPQSHEQGLYEYVAPLPEAPPADIQEQIAAVEAQRGVLPISLRAFYEIIGAVDLRGYFPVPEDQWAFLQITLTSDFGPVPETLDSLMVYPLNEASQQQGAERGKATLYITPDPLAKMDFSAVGDMEITLPCETADVSVWLDHPYEGDDDTDDDLFVASLRRAFRYGGCNQTSDLVVEDFGMDAGRFLRALRTPTGESYLDYLTRDLLPI